jgi:SAM-dependent methyltransferase
MSYGALNFYVCPKCHGALQGHPATLYCPACRREFPCIEGIPDFLLETPQESADPFLQDIDNFGWLAAIYETPLWFPIMLRLLGGKHASTLGELSAFGRGLMSGVYGPVLDVATGTGTYGRHVARTGRAVYGIDVSLDMIRKGQTYVRRDGVAGMHFARAHVDALPFADHIFAGCLLCGSLHIFPDTQRALVEVSRTLKPGAMMWVTTVVRGESGILKFERVRRRIEQNKKMRVFEITNFPHMLTDAGFEHVEVMTHGSLASITARKM